MGAAKARAEGLTLGAWERTAPRDSKPSTRG